MSETVVQLCTRAAGCVFLAAAIAANGARAGSPVGTLAGGNLVVADTATGLWEVDPVAGYFVQIIAADAGYGPPRGVAVVADPRGMPQPLLVVAFDGDDPRVFSAGGDALASCSTAGFGAADVEATADGSAFYSAGARLFRHQLFDVEGLVGCSTGPAMGLADIEGELGSPAQSLALFEPAGEISEIFLALGASGIGSFDPEDRSLAVIPGTPTPEGDVIFGVATTGSALLFTQLALDGFACEAQSGVFAAFLGIAPLTQGGLLHCPHAVAPAGERLFVTDRPTALGGSGAKIVELAQNPSSFEWEQIRALPFYVEEPLDIEVVPAPEPRAAWIALGALSVLLAWHRRQSPSATHRTARKSPPATGWPGIDTEPVVGR